MVHWSRRTEPRRSWVLAATATALVAQGPPPAAPCCQGNHLTHWTTREGLPQNSVTRLCQTRDGQLWVGTFDGLARFDGDTFTTINVANTRQLPGNRIQALFEDGAGTLWIGFGEGGAATWRAGALTTVTMPEPDTAVNAFAETRDHRMLVATNTGVVAVTDGVGRKVPFTAPALATDLLCRRDGAVLVSTDAGLWQLEPGPATRITSVRIDDLAESDGIVYGCNGASLYRLDGGGLTVLPTAAGEAALNRLLPTPDGGLLLATADGILQLTATDLAGTSPPDAATRRIATTPGVLAMLHDSEGNLWHGSTSFGLRLQRRSALTGWSATHGLPTPGCISVAADPDGSMLFGTRDGLLRLRDDRFTFDADVAAAGLRWIGALVRDPDGTLWIGHERRVSRVAGDDVRTFGPDSGLPPGDVRALLRDREGVLWAATESGPYVFVDQRFRAFEGRSPLRGAELKVIVAADDGALWFGGTRVLARLAEDRDTWRVWRAGVHLPAAEVRTIVAEPDGSAWIATYGGGICRVAGDTMVQIDRRRGLFHDSLCSAMREDGRWFVNSNAGLFTFRHEDLAAVADGRLPDLQCQPLMPPAGIHDEGSGGVQPACARGADGRLWFLTVEGVIAIDPRSVGSHDVPPRCLLTGARIGDHAVPAGPMHVRAGESRTPTIEFTAISFARSEPLRFRWRLHALGGQPGIWSTPLPQRAVRLPELTPGEHMFEVAAAGADGQWSLPARVPITVAPLFTERWPFLGLCVAAVLASFALLWRLGAGHAARRAHRLAHLVAERTADLRAEIAERRRAEAALRTTQRELEARVRKRTARLHQTMQRLRDDAIAREQAERQLQRLQRMQSIGSLAGGVAHDFNNLLTVVLGCSSLLQSRTTDPETRDLARSIHDAGERGRRLTQHLLTFASRRVVPTTVLDLGAILDDLLPMLHRLLGDAVRLHWQPPPAPVLVTAAQVQIEQILVNLCVNAHEAMPAPGDVEIGLHPATPDRPTVRLTVTDNGTGMPPEVRERAFEPFFSTRNKPGGGLGLASVYGIVRQLGGDVELDSKVGAGTTVTISLPAATGAALAPPVTIQPARLHGGGHVLLIDDEANVRSALSRLLTQAGFTVSTAETGEAAVAQLRDRAEPVDVVLSDVVMPGLRDRALVAALHAIRPGLPIVFMTGCLDRESLGGDLAPFEVIGKPPVPAQLTAALLRAMADQRQPDNKVAARR